MAARKTKKAKTGTEEKTKTDVEKKKQQDLEKQKRILEAERIKQESAKRKAEKKAAHEKRAKEAQEAKRLKLEAKEENKKKRKIEDQKNREEKAKKKEEKKERQQKKQDMAQETNARSAYISLDEDALLEQLRALAERHGNVKKMNLRIHVPTVRVEFEKQEALESFLSDKEDLSLMSVASKRSALTKNKIVGFSFPAPDNSNYKDALAKAKEMLSEFGIPASVYMTRVRGGITLQYESEEDAKAAMKKINQNAEFRSRIAGPAVILSNSQKNKKRKRRPSQNQEEAKQAS